jgi:formamidopyrimidine-DNA glycosylase
VPELPEVEFARRSLERWLGGRTVQRVEAPPSRVFRGGDPAAFAAALAGRRLRGIERRGKYLLLSFDRDVGVLAHLGMTGKWVRRRAAEPDPGHPRARLLLARGGRVVYDDPRMFGRLVLAPAGRLRERSEVAALGPDPLADGLDPADLAARLARTSRNVKVALMDQAVVAGIGNIQASEALFRARIDPRRLARELSRREVRALVRAIEASIAFTLEAQANEEIAYVDEGGPNPFLVYARANAACPRCRHPLERIVQGGRSTYFCPRCQL